MGNQGRGRHARFTWASRPGGGCPFAGFTLLEVSVAAAVAMLVLGVFMTVVALSRQSWETGSVEALLRQEGQRALDRMVRELRQADSGTITVPADGEEYTDVWFRVPRDSDADGEIVDQGIVQWSPTIQYGVSRDGEPHLLRKEAPDAAATVVISDVTGVRFRRAAEAPTVVEVTLTLSKATVSGRVITRAFTAFAKMRN